MELRDKLKLNRKQTHELGKEIEQKIEHYVDEYEQVYFSCDSNMLYIVVRGFKFWIHFSTSITELKPDTCSNTTPRTEKEFRELLENNRIALRVARQAYLYFKYVS